MIPPVGQNRSVRQRAGRATPGRPPRRRPRPGRTSSPCSPRSSSGQHLRDGRRAGQVAAGRCRPSRRAARASLPGRDQELRARGGASLAWPGATIVPAPTRISGTSAAIAPDRVERDRRAQGQLDDRQAARDEGAGERHGVVERRRSTTTGMTGTTVEQSDVSHRAFSVADAAVAEDAGARVGRADGGAEGREQLAAGADERAVRRVRRPGGASSSCGVDEHLERARRRRRGGSGRRRAPGRAGRRRRPRA